jgi:hypothetical protein
VDLEAAADGGTNGREEHLLAERRDKPKPLQDPSSWQGTTRFPLRASVLQV